MHSNFPASVSLIACGINFVFLCLPSIKTFTGKFYFFTSRAKSPLPWEVCFFQVFSVFILLDFFTKFCMSISLECLVSEFDTLTLILIQSSA